MIHRDKLEADLQAMQIDVAGAALQALLNALIETDTLFGDVMPAGTRHGYMVGMMAFLSRLPSESLQLRARVLDIGSGHGRLLLGLQRAFGMQAYGVDKFAYAGLDSPDDKLGATRTLWAVHDRAGLRILSPFDIERQPLPYPDGFFDIITSQQTIEHLHDSPKVMLEEAFRVLRAGGLMILDTPNHAYWGYHVRALRGESLHWPLADYYNHQYSKAHGGYLGHTREFTVDELKTMFQWAGFEVIAAETAMYAPGAEDLTETLAHYIWEMRMVLRDEYGAELSDPGRDHLRTVADKILRLRDTVIITARKPA